MPTEHHHLVGLLPAHDLAHHVAGGRLAFNSVDATSQMWASKGADRGTTWVNQCPDSSAVTNIRVPLG